MCWFVQSIVGLRPVNIQVHLQARCSSETHLSICISVLCQWVASLPVLDPAAEHEPAAIRHNLSDCSPKQLELATEEDDVADWQHMVPSV